jgi:hypothetical protein
VATGHLLPATDKLLLVSSTLLDDSNTYGPPDEVLAPAAEGRRGWGIDW